MEILFGLVVVLLHVSVDCSAALQHVHCKTTAGDFTIQLERVLSPMGVDRFLELVETKFFDDQVIYRVQPGMLIQFGLGADPEVTKQWFEKPIPDEPRKVPFEHGTISFSGYGSRSRAHEFFIALAPDGTRVHGNQPFETPLGRVIDGLEVLEKIQANYKESGIGGPQDYGKLATKLRKKGNKAAKKYPNLDRIKRCRFPDAKDEF